MQQRHLDRKQYFQELANTSRKYYIGIVQQWIPLNNKTKVLEIGCGEGGNLLPFAELGCTVTGIDIDAKQIKNADTYFKENNHAGTFIASDFLDVPIPASEEERYDVILVHDVIEHIEPPYKLQFINLMQQFMKHDAIAFFCFPAWQMPFGGHQQICVGKISKLPYIHLLPMSSYRSLLKKAGESETKVEGLLSIKRAKTPIELFECLVKEAGLRTEKRTLWLINPHYQQKFGLHPIRECWPFSKLVWLRNFYTTSAWYILKKS